MNFLKKGPELKLSELKIPDIVYDVYYDLKERHLLPLVVILLVALVAVPIFLERSKHSNDQEPSATPPVTASASSAAGGDEALVVARTEPGLRELHRRFKHYRALDPFSEKASVEGASESDAEGAAETSGEAGEPVPTAAQEPPVEATVIGGAAATSPPVESSPPVEGPAAPAEAAPSPAPGSGGGDGGSTRTRYASNSIDVRIVAVPPGAQSDEDAKKSSKQKPKAEVRHNLPELTMLPTRATPAVAFMGTSRDGKKALFLVSSDVVSIFGEGSCVIGSQTCQLLALEPDLPETFVYGPQERAYRIELLKITRTLSAEPRRAALGTTKHPGQGEAHESEGTKPASRGEATQAPAS